MFKPTNNNIIPAIDIGTAKAKEKEDPPEDIIIALPSAMHIHAEMTMFSRL
jgi:hypothetical protein|tara:strand:+ start:6201 stop:6353 length:153 start_codon:yes stop_codon:yes gene_type:complete